MKSLMHIVYYLGRIGWISEVRGGFWLLIETLGNIKWKLQSLRLEKSKYCKFS